MARPRFWLVHECDQGSDPSTPGPTQAQASATMTHVVSKMATMFRDTGAHLPTVAQGAVEPTGELKLGLSMYVPLETMVTTCFQVCASIH